MVEIRWITKHRVTLFVLWCLVYVFTAIVLPTHARSISFFQRIVVTTFALSTLLLTTSFGSYFVEAWQHVRDVPNRRQYVAWLAFETILGVSFTLGLMVFAFVCLWVVLFR